MRERIFESRGGVVHEGRGEEESQNSEGRERVSSRDQPEGQDGSEEGGEEGGEVGVASREVEQRQQEHPQRMGVGLDALGEVPRQAVAVDEVVHGAEGDVGIVADPRGAEEEKREGEEREAEEKFSRHGRGKFIIQRGGLREYSFEYNAAN